MDVLEPASTSVLVPQVLGSALLLIGFGLYAIRAKRRDGQV